MENSDESKIEKLKEALYSRRIEIKPKFVLDLHGHKTDDVKDVWQEPIKNTSEKVELNNLSFFKKIFIFSLIFFVVSVSLAGFFYFRGTNMISPKKIVVDVVGPTSVKSGEESSFDVTVTNNNNTPILIADLLIDYPDGTRKSISDSEEMKHDRVILGDIAPGESIRKTVRAVLFGEEGKKQPITFSVEYRVSDTTSVFNKDQPYEILLGSSPITISIDAFKEITANQDYEIVLNVNSNLNETVKNILLNAEMPFGYEPEKYTPEPIQRTTTWNLGDIEPKGKRVIKIKGKMYGEKDEERFFKFTVGTKDTKTQSSIGGVVTALTHSVIVKEPFLGIALLFDKEEAKDYVAVSGSQIYGTVQWKNNLNVPIYDLVIEARIRGNAVDNRTIEPQLGFYDSKKDVMIWSKFDKKSLEQIKPKDSGAVEFDFNTWSAYEKKDFNLSNPEFVVDITVKAKRRLESGVPEELVSNVQRTIKVKSSVRMASVGTHSTGPIENEGTTPPKVDKKTTYTIIWTIFNTFNELNDVKVKTVLPSYIEWTGFTSPSSESFTYNQDTREVTWNVGKVSKASIGEPEKRQAFFQIGLTPSITQKGTEVQLLNVATLTAHDTFTDTEIKSESGIVTTKLETDPDYEYEDERVVE